MNTPKSSRKRPVQSSNKWSNEDSLEQDSVVKSVGYKKARDLLNSLGIDGLSPTKKKISKEMVFEHLKVIVKREDFETLTLKRAILLLEEHFDETIDPSLKHFIRTSLSDLISRKVEGKLDDEADKAKPAKEPEVVLVQIDPVVKSERVAEVKSEDLKASTSSESVSNFKPSVARSNVAGTGIPVVFPKSIGKHATSTFLIELHNPNKAEDSKSMNLSGDTGAVGRISVIDAEGTRFTDSPTKAKSQKKRDVLYKSRYKKGSSLRIDFKGDVYQGVLTNSAVSACVVSVTEKVAEVRSVHNRFIQAQFQKNIMQNLHGEMVKGDVDVSKFTYSRDHNVNTETSKVSIPEKAKGDKDKNIGNLASKKRKSVATRSKPTKKSKQ